VIYFHSTLVAHFYDCIDRFLCVITFSKSSGNKHYRTTKLRNRTIDLTTLLWRPLWKYACFWLL